MGAEIVTDPDTGYVIDGVDVNVLMAGFIGMVPSSGYGTAELTFAQPWNDQAASTPICDDSGVWRLQQ